VIGIEAMKAVDPIRVRNMLGNIADSQRRLRQLGQLAESDFLADFRNTESAKYLLIVAAEAAIDLCNHIVSCQGGRAPQDYADCFTILANINVIEHDLSGRLQKMAQFGKSLLHEYAQVDNQRVYHIIQDNLPDFDTFREQLLAWLG
jgi:uncharacterized protein YutE (UPF0331/DUF86 family)